MTDSPARQRLLLFISTLKPIIEQDLGALVTADDERYDLQFERMTRLIATAPAVADLFRWQRVEIAAALVGYRAATGGVRVDYKSPTRYLMLLRRARALIAGDFEQHATRQDVISQAESYGASETSARRLIDDTEAQGLITICDCRQNQSKFVVPTGGWMRSHCVKQLCVMLYRYSLYRLSGDSLASATFQTRWVREFGFRQSTLDLAEKIWRGLSI